MGDHSAITPDNYPHLPQLTIAVANYYARATQITMLNNILGESHDPTLRAQLRSKISQLKNERDEMMAAHLPPATEEFESTDMDTPLTLTEQDWNSINAVVNAGLVEELNIDRLPGLAKLKPASRRALEIQATVIALGNAKASQDQFRGTGKPFGLGRDETVQKEVVQRIDYLQQRGRRLVQNTQNKPNN